MAMDQLKRWSELYNIPIEALSQLVALLEDKRQRVDCSTAYKIVHKNSQLLHALLADLPLPRKKMESSLTIIIDFLFPSSQGWKHFFEGQSNPVVTLAPEEKSTIIYTASGIQCCLESGSPEEEKELRQTYVHIIGRYPQGYAEVLSSGIPELLEKEFFISSCAVGKLGGNILPLAQLDHRSLFVPDPVLIYTSAGYHFDFSTEITYKNLDVWWRKRDSGTIEEKIEGLNNTFFRNNYGSPSK